MTELQKPRPEDFSPSASAEQHAAFIEAERDYYKARCALAEEALRVIRDRDVGTVNEVLTPNNFIARKILEAIAASEHP